MPRILIITIFMFMKENFLKLTGALVQQGHICKRLETYVSKPFWGANLLSKQLTNLSKNLNAKNTVNSMFVLQKRTR
jgi:hypothetical protein